MVLTEDVNNGEETEEKKQQFLACGILWLRMQMVNLKEVRSSDKKSEHKSFCV